MPPLLQILLYRVHFACLCFISVNFEWDISVCLRNTVLRKALAKGTKI